MNTLASQLAQHAGYPVTVDVQPVINDRNRLTTAFRIILAVPHLLLVGGPITAVFTWAWSYDSGLKHDWTAGGGVLGAVAVVTAIIAWFGIVFTGKHPAGLWNLAVFYLRWRVRAVAYTALLRDEYPPFGDESYPANLEIAAPNAPRNRLAVAFRLFLVLPHLIALWVLCIAWAFTTVIAWFSIVLTGRYPAALYDFALGVLRWNVRVEAYALLLRDEYPPFSFE